jgi:hypothetical protein
VKTAVLAKEGTRRQVGYIYGVIVFVSAIAAKDN